MKHNLSLSIMLSLMIILSVVTLSAFPSICLADEEVSVTVTGKAPVKGGNVSAARTMAILSAKSIAVEEGAGLILTVVDRPDLTRVELKSRGRVLEYSIDSEGVEADIYAVTMTAKVLFPGVSKAVSASGQPGSPVAVRSGYEPLVVKKPEGRVDWQSGKVFALGRGKAGSDAQTKMLARRAAVADAYRNALLLVLSVNADASSNVRQLADTHGVTQAIEAKVRGGRISSESRDPQSGDVTIEIEIPLWGIQGIHSVLVPHVRTRHQQKEEKAPAAVKGEEAPPSASEERPAVPPPDTTVPKQEDKANIAKTEEEYTGIIVDATDIDAEPAIFPAVEAAGGEQVWDASSADEASIEQHGMAEYVIPASSDGSAGEQGRVLPLRWKTGSSPLFASRDIRAAFTALDYPIFVAQSPDGTATPFPTRAGRKPLIVKGIQSSGDTRSTIMISKADAEKLRESAELQKHLKDCRVVVVVRSEAGGTEGSLRRLNLLAVTFPTP